MNSFALSDTPRQVKLTVADLALLDQSGAFERYRKVELIDGRITEMSPLGLRHAIVSGAIITRLQVALETLAPTLRALAAPTIALPPHDAPEPDVVVFDGPASDDYADRSGVRVVVEVAAATLRSDLTVKRDIYARASLPEYWVIDVEGGKVHQFWSPVGGGYMDSRIVPLAGELRSATMPELAIDGSGIL